MHSTPKDVLDEGLCSGASQGRKWRLLVLEGFDTLWGWGQGGNSHNRVKPFFPTKFLRGLSTFFRYAWITKKNFCIVFLRKLFGKTFFW